MIPVAGRRNNGHPLEGIAEGALGIVTQMVGQYRHLRAFRAQCPLRQQHEPLRQMRQRRDPGHRLEMHRETHAGHRGGLGQLAELPRPSRIAVHHRQRRSQAYLLVAE